MNVSHPLKHAAFDVRKVCRTCLCERKQMRSLNEIDANLAQGLRFADILSQFTSFQIDLDIGLPSQVCLQCVQQAHQCYTFKQLCHQSETSLRQYLGKPMLITSSKPTQYEDSDSESSTTSEDQEEDVDDRIEALHFETIAQNNPQDEKFVAQKQLIKHMKQQKEKRTRSGRKKCRTDVKSKKSMQCNVCKKTFLNSKSFRKHLRTHFEDRPFKCVDCPRSFTEENYLRNHMRTHIPDADKPHECEHCAKRFIHITLLKKHLLKHSDQKPFVCRICNKGCYAENSLIKHMKIHERKQGEREGHICDYCKTELESEQELADHIKQHTGSRPFLCTVCGKSFPQRFNLELHLRTHTGERPFTCEICKNGYVSKASLKIHMRTHTNERPFVCDFCGKAFRQSGDLTSHKRLHGTEKPIECSICQKRFTTVMKLKYHMRNHTGERPYVCNVCGRGFTVNTILLRHMRVHSGERPYVCVTCGKAFSQSSTLNTHMKVHQSQSSKFQGIEDAPETPESDQQQQITHLRLPQIAHPHPPQLQMENAHILSEDATAILHDSSAHLLSEYKELSSDDKFLDNARILVNVTTEENQLIDDDDARLLSNINVNDKYLNGYDPFQRAHHI